MSSRRKYRLLVNLSASQTRKRLKGHGFGVRRVEASDRNQSVITHTATGQHEQDLKALFRDVLPPAPSPSADSPVQQLKNLGPVSAAWLRNVGVNTLLDLERLGAVAAYRLVRQRRPDASLNLLWALAAAIGNRDWRDLTTQEKERLRRELEDG